jgi:hypothetical protein
LDLELKERLEHKVQKELKALQVQQGFRERLVLKE